MNSVKPIIIGSFLVGLLFLPTRNGQAFVTPQHYERMKMEQQDKTRRSENVQTQAPVVIQVHQPNPGQPRPAKPARNNPPGDSK